MTVTHYGDQEYYGLSTDTKPLVADTAVGAIYRATDTHEDYINNGTVWALYRSAAGPYKYFIYLDPIENKFKAVNGKTGVVDYISAGSTDAQPVIQSAINANTNAPGKILLASNTTFPLVTTVTGSPNRTLNIRSGQWLQGGGTSTILELNGGIIGIYGLTVNDVTISDLTIDGNNDNGSSGFSGQGGNIVFTAGAGQFCNRIWIERVKCLNSPEVGIKAKQTNYFHANFNHVEVTALNAGVGYAGIQSTQGSGLCEFIGNTIINPGGPAFGVNGQSAGNYQIIMTGNNCIVTPTSPITTFYGRGQIHIEADAPNVDTDLIIANNTIWSNYYCVHILGGKHINISGNIFKQTGFITTALHAIDLERDTADDITIHNNKFYDIPENAINCDSPLGDITITGNTIIDPSGKTLNTFDGIRITAASGKTISRLKIKDNRIRESRGGSARMRHGIAIITTGSGVITDAIIEANEIYGAVTSRILESGSGLTYEPENRILTGKTISNDSNTLANVGGYNAIIYKAGSVYKSVKGDGTLLGSSTTLDAVVQAALDVKGIIVWKSTSDGSAYVPSGAFTGWNLSEDTELLIGRSNNITMPSGYAGYVFQVDDTIGGDHQLTRITVSGGRFTEGGASPSANWTLFRIRSGSSTPGNAGVYGNTFDHIYVKRCKTMFDLIANSGTESWLNGNLFTNCWCDYPKQGVVFQMGALTPSIQAINKNTFFRVVIQADPSYTTQPLAMTHGYKDISGMANNFFGCIVWDVKIPNTTCNLTNKAEGTVIDGGTMLQEPYDWEMSQNLGKRTVITGNEKTGGESVGSNTGILNPFYRKSGTFMGAGGISTSLVGDGILNGLVSAGGTISNALTVSGLGKRAATGTTADTITGMRTGTTVCLRYWNPYLAVKFKFVQTTAQRCFIGYSSALNPTINTSEDPLVSLSGYGLYHSTTSTVSPTNWLVARNTGTATSTITDTGIPANVTSLQTVYLAGWEEGPKFQWRVGDIAGQIGEHTTTIPAQTTGLALGSWLSNPGVTTDKFIDLMGAYFKLNKSEG